MKLADTGPAHDTSTDVRRLLDAGYQVSFQLWNLDGTAAYFANVTTESGSRWKGLGPTPGDALRSVWPLGGGPGQGGCGHCGGMGCTVPDCRTCAAYVEPLDGTCGVCGYADPDADEGDDLEPYCQTCGARAGIFIGHGPDWHHYTGEGTVLSRVKLFNAGHAPVIAWREAKRPLDPPVTLCGARPYPAGSEGDDGTECALPAGHDGHHDDEPWQLAATQAFGLCPSDHPSRTHGCTLEPRHDGPHQSLEPFSRRVLAQWDGQR